MQDIILRNLMDDKDYYQKVYPHLNENHFSTIEAQEIFKTIKSYTTEFSEQPKKKEIGLMIKNNAKLNEKVKDSSITYFKHILTDDKVENKEFLINETEKYIQKVEMTTAILKSADIIKKDGNFEQVLGFVSDALKIKFDKEIGMSYKNSLEHRLEYYHKKNSGFTTGIESVDRILGGGFKPKTLNVFGAPSHTGKSMALISVTCALALQKKKVLFIPLEMSEEEIAKRMDSNILDVDSNELKNIELDVLRAKFDKIKEYLGESIIKEYPAGVMSTFKLESLLDTLALEDGFIPDVIVIDYLTLMASSRVTMSQAGGGYAYYKAIAEELHGLAKKYNIPVVTAAQLNRSAYGNKDAGMESIADSLGIVQTADVFIAMITDDILKENGRMYWKLLKNRNTGILKSQLVGMKFANARFYEVDEAGDTATNIQSNFNVPSSSGLDVLQGMGQDITNTLDVSVLNFN